MKQRIIALLTTGLLILSLAGCAAQNTTAPTLPESVTAGGSGKATAAADIAQLTLGVETAGATTEAAREKNAESAQKMAEAAGRTLGDVISMEESSYGGATLVRQQAEDGSFTDATLSAPGDLSVTAEVRVIYELK